MSKTPLLDDEDDIAGAAQIKIDIRNDNFRNDTKEAEYNARSNNRLRHNYSDADSSSIRFEHGQVYCYLKEYFFELTWADIIKLYFLSTASTFYNIAFIIYNFINLFVSSYNVDYDSKDFKYGAIIVVYVEFVGLLMIILLAIYAGLRKKYATMADFIQFCGQWSAFKLFYQFRPVSIVNYMSDIYNNNHRSYLKKIDQEIAELQNTKNNNNDKDKKKKDAYKMNRGQQIRAIFWTICILKVLIIGLMIGFIAFVIKISQLSFIGDNTSNGKTIADYTFTEWFSLIGFCNQLWGMVNEEQIVLNSILEFLYIDLVSFAVNRDSQFKIMAMKSIIKNTLIKRHGKRGLFIAIGLNQQILSKILRKIPQSMRRYYKKPAINNSKKQIEKKTATQKTAASTAKKDEGGGDGISGKMKNFSANMIESLMSSINLWKKRLNYGKNNESQPEIVPNDVKLLWIKQNRLHINDKPNLKLRDVSYMLVSRNRNSINTISSEYTLVRSITSQKKSKVQKALAGEEIVISLNGTNHASFMIDWMYSYWRDLVKVLGCIYFSLCILFSGIGLIAQHFGSVDDVKLENTCSTLDIPYDSVFKITNLIILISDFVALMYFILEKYYENSIIVRLVKSIADSNFVGGILACVYLVYPIVIWAYLINLGFGKHDSNADYCWRYLNHNYTMIVVAIGWWSTVYLIFAWHIVLILLIYIATKIIPFMLQLFVFATVFTDVFVIPYVIVTFLVDWNYTIHGALKSENLSSIFSCGIISYLMYFICMLYISSWIICTIEYVIIYIITKQRRNPQLKKSKCFVYFVKSISVIVSYIINGIYLILTIGLFAAIGIIANNENAQCHAIVSDYYVYWDMVLMAIFVIGAILQLLVYPIVLIFVRNNVDEKKQHGVKMTAVDVVSAHYVLIVLALIGKPCNCSDWIFEDLLDIIEYCHTEYNSYN